MLGHRGLIRTSFLPILLALVWGCSSDPAVEERPETAPVTGTVTYKSQPVTDAEVIFKPDVPPGPGAPANVRGAFGKTDPAGKFTLRTFEAGDGAVPGKYVVTVTKYDRPPASSTVKTEDPEYNDPETAGTATPEPKNLLPAKYAGERTSDLKVTVTAEGGDFPLALTD